MYSDIINLAVASGDSLVKLAGKIQDIGIKKQYLTEKDLEIERNFLQLINTFSGDHSLFAEEENDEFKQSQNVWVIDPISNTFNFVHGFPHYAVVVSHIFKGETVFALVYDPSIKELFLAEKGKGVSLNGEKIFVNTRQSEFCIMYDYAKEKTSDEIGFEIMSGLNKLGKVKKSWGSMGLQYAYVACGRASATVSVNRDIFPEIAGELIVTEAGGKVTDFQGNKINLGTTGVVYSNGLIHDQILKIVDSYIF